MKINRLSDTAKYGTYKKMQDGGAPDVNALLQALAAGDNKDVRQMQRDANKFAVKSARQDRRDENEQYRKSMSVYQDLLDMPEESLSEEQKSFMKEMESFLMEEQGPQDASTSIGKKDLGKLGAIGGGILTAGAIAEVLAKRKMDAENQFGTSLLERLLNRD